VDRAEFERRYEEIKQERRAVGGFYVDLKNRLDGELSALDQEELNDLLRVWNNAVSVEHDLREKAFDLLRRVHAQLDDLANGGKPSP
jgi:hypothetical protein